MDENIIRPRITVYEGELLRDGITKILSEQLDHVLESRELQALEVLRDKLILLVSMHETRQQIRELKSSGS